jgi:hypothetical protein
MPPHERQRRDWLLQLSGNTAKSLSDCVETKI